MKTGRLSLLSAVERRRGCNTSASEGKCHYFHSFTLETRQDKTDGISPPVTYSQVASALHLLYSSFYSLSVQRISESDLPSTSPSPLIPQKIEGNVGDRFLIFSSSTFPLQHLHTLHFTNDTNFLLHQIDCNLFLLSCFRPWLARLQISSSPPRNQRSEP